MHFRSDSLSVTRTLLGTSLLGSLILASQRIQSPKARRIPCTATSAKRDALLHQFRDAFYVKGYHSGRYLGATHDGHVIHDEVPTEFHLFVFVPGMDVFTGFVKLYHLASDRSIFVTPEGLLGCYHGDFEEHWWRVLPRDDKGSFSLVNFATESWRESRPAPFFWQDMFVGCRITWLAAFAPDSL